MKDADMQIADRLQYYQTWWTQQGQHTVLTNTDIVIANHADNALQFNSDMQT